MYPTIRFTEYLDLDLETELWTCHDCGHRLTAARASYKTGCLVAERDPREVHAPVIDGEYTFAPDSNWIRIVEFYCPGCGRQIETEYLPPGHPITHDIDVDIDALKARIDAAEIAVIDGKICRAKEAAQ